MWSTQLDSLLKMIYEIVSFANVLKLVLSVSFAHMLQ